MTIHPNLSVELYVDGACRGNPGPGGWGAYICHPDGKEQELCGGEQNTTNNRMELTAAIKGITHLDAKLPLVIWTDSKYVLQGITEWIIGWKKKNWRKADGKAVINADLWRVLDEACQGRNIQWRWIKGHSGHAGNERADMLANRGTDQLGANQLTSNQIETSQMSTAADHLSNSISDMNTAKSDHNNDTINNSDNDWLSNDPLGFDMMEQDIMEQDMDEYADEGSHTRSDDSIHSNLDASVASHVKEINPAIAIKRTAATLNLQGKRQLILDTETTGFSFADGDRVIEIGVLEMINRKLTGSSFHVYVNPQRPVGSSVDVHGITDEFLQDKLLFAQIVHELDDYLQGGEIIAHNANFDMNFLEGEFLKAGFSSLKNRVSVLDTLAMAKRKHPGQKNSLDALVRRYEIKQRDRTFHGALLDAEILADVFLFMTGGQVTLDMGDEQQNSGGSNRHKQHKGRFNLAVIAASGQENQSHSEWLQQFAEKHGMTSLWQS